MNASPPIAVFAPAKLNLFLAVTGRRSDGFHDLLSLVAPLDFGDTLRLEPRADRSADDLICDAPGVPADATNLVLRAAAAWRGGGWPGAGGPFCVGKAETPAGAGMGGGSSDAVAALRGLQALADAPLAADRLAEIAATLGSDCPLFLADGPVVMRGRGEILTPLAAEARARLTGRRVLVFKPDFGIETPWAYGRLAAGAPATYLAAAAAETRLAGWERGAAELEAALFNSFAAVVYPKFIALPAMVERLRKRCGLSAHLTGSGSACFALLPSGAAADAARAVIRDGWGPTAFVTEARLG